MADPRKVVRYLAERIRALEAADRLGAGAVPLDAGGLGAIFPRGELPTGTLCELLPRVMGAGAWTLALLLARQACGEDKALVIADPERCFYPPAARRLGIEPARTILIRPRTEREAVLAAAQALRSSAVGAAVGAFAELADREARRLQLAAEAGGSLGLLVRPAAALQTPSFAAVRLLLDAMPWARGRRRLQVIHCRGGREGQPTCLEVDDATGHVRAFSRLELAAESAPTA